jgi:predicted nucleotidyltransferase
MNKLVSYSSYFVYFLLNELETYSNIKGIILFGSVARGDANKDSDVDIFIDVNKKTKNFEKITKKIISDFYKSRQALLFKNKGIDNKINLIIGKLNEWKDLETSIESTGIILYGKYVSSGVRGRKYALIFWDKIGKNRGAFLNKIYGFKVGKKEYKGLVEILGGKRTGKSSVMIPIEHREEILKLLKKYKVNAKIMEIFGK